MSEPITLRHRADLEIASITVDRERRPALMVALAGALGHDLPIPGTPTGDDPVAIWRSPTELLLIGLPLAIERTAPDIASALGNAPHLFEPRETGLTLIELAGPGLHALLPLPGPPAPSRRSAATRLADLRVTMLRHAGAAERLWLIAERSSADYLRAWLARRIEIAASAPLTP